MSPSKTGAPVIPPRAVPRPRTEAVSRRERLALLVHRELDRRLTPLGVWVFRRTNGGIARPWHVDALLLTTTGRRSGRGRTVVLQYFPDGDAAMVAAANDGGAALPAWYLNLAACPRARVEIRGRARDVRAEDLPPDEAAAWWRRILDVAPSYERYARAAGRAIPIIRLVPTSAAAPPLEAPPPRA